MGCWVVVGGCDAEREPLREERDVEMDAEAIAEGDDDATRAAAMSASGLRRLEWDGEVADAGEGTPEGV